MKNIKLETFPILTTESLSLRQLSRSDAEEILLLRSDPLINKYLNRELCKTLGDALEFIKKIKDNRLYYWAITQKENEKFVGTICLFDISEELKKCEIGYELLTDYQGKGIMREAAKRVIEYITQILELDTIYASTHMHNQGSIGLLNELKFKVIESIDETNPTLVLFRLKISSINRLSVN